jgi:hypothetical protein
MAAPKKKPVSRQKKVIDLDDYSALDAYAISLNEYYKSLRRAGFSSDMAFWLILDKDSYPDWILPKPINPDHVPLFDPYEDEDED